MKKIVILFMASLCLTLSAKTGPRDSKTSFVREVLQPFVDDGRLAGAISVFYKDGVQETCCIGYADVSQKRPIKMDNVFMQCSQTKGFCGVTIAKLVEEGKLYEVGRYYSPDYMIMDASGWSMDFKFEGGSIHSGGYDTGPDNAITLSRILDFLKIVYSS